MEKPRNIERQTAYELVEVNDLFILICDKYKKDSGMVEITANPDSVCAEISKKVGIGQRRLYYRDALGIIDELTTCNEKFMGFSLCEPEQQAFFYGLIDKKNRLVK